MTPIPREILIMQALGAILIVAGIAAISPAIALLVAGIMLIAAGEALNNRRPGNGSG